MTATNSATTCRVPLIDPATVSDPVVKSVFAEIERELGFGIVPNIFRALAGQPTILRATWDLFRAVVLQGVLPRAVKEMVGVAVSVANKSEYALKVHLHSLGVQGVHSGVLTTLAAGGVDVEGLAPSVAAIIRLAHKAAHHGPLAVDDADIAAAQEEGVTDAELAEVFAAIDLFQYVNSFTDLVRVPVDAI